jgi:hypothetical protein
MSTFKSKMISVKALNLIANSRPHAVLLGILIDSPKEPSGYIVPDAKLRELANAMSETGGSIYQNILDSVQAGDFGDDIGHICRVVDNAKQYTYTNVNVLKSY